MIIIIMEVCCVLLMVSSVLAEEDKNGVSPNTISLPSGPGSIEGMGEAFQPMLNTGSARYEVKLSLPQGTAGHTPALSLRYESGHGDGPLGIGWSIGPGSISRQTDKGIPRYVDGPNGLDDDNDGTFDEFDEQDTFIGLEGEELADVGGGVFRARIEGVFIRYRRLSDHWQADLRDGSTLVFGNSATNRLTDSTSTKVSQWLLEKSTDANGNTIDYRYISFPGSDNQKYLSEIHYGPGSSPWPVNYFVAFSYEDRPDWRKDYRAGFPVKTAKRLKNIYIGIQGHQPEKCVPFDWNSDGLDDGYLIRRYAIDYDDTNPLLSPLQRVTQYGANKSSYLPPITFFYTTIQPEENVSAAGSIIGSANSPATVMDSPLVELIDLNRDGLPDLLKTNYAGGEHMASLNKGVEDNGTGQQIKWHNPAPITSSDGLAAMLDLSSERINLEDMNGDGIADIVHTTHAGEVFYHKNMGDASWSDRKQMSIQDTAPPAPFASKEVKIADLDFNKQIDVVKSSEQGYSLWFNLEDGTYSRETRTSGATYLGRLILFSDPGVHLADMNGDRLSDVCRIYPTKIVYAANMGHGNFADALEVTIPDTVLTSDSNGQVAKAKLQDINNDGLADLVLERAVSGQLWYWLNSGIDTLTSKHTLTDMPTMFGENTATRWADINGNGTTDLIYADSSAIPPIRAIDIGLLISGTGHTNLLSSIDNGLGVVTTLSYKTSTDYYLEAEAAPWTSTIPFPVSAIARVETTTGLDLDDIPGKDHYVKEYLYRNGYYEDMEKAFRGFAEVTVTEVGDSTAPTQVSAYSFFTGGPDGQDNDNDTVIDEVSHRFHHEEDALKGKIRSMEIRSEDDTLYSREENSWLVRNLLIGGDDIEIRFAYNEESQKHIFEGLTTPEILRTTFLYDDYGNTLEEKNYGALSLSGDERFSYTEYINDETLWLLGLPQRQYITDEPGTIFSETRSYYDGPEYDGLPLGQAIKGNLTRQQGWVKHSTFIDLIRNQYDQYGNITAIKDPRGYLRIIEWDTLLHVFPETEIIEGGSGNEDLSIEASYNLGLGVVDSSTDFNGHETGYGYDVFSRLTSIVRPGDSDTFPSLLFTYTMADPENSLLYSYDADGNLTETFGQVQPSSVMTQAREEFGQSGTFDTTQYVDGLGRKLATVEEGETDFVVKEAALFDARGSARSLFLPYDTTSSSYQKPDSSALSAITKEYDPLGREIKSTNPPDIFAATTFATMNYLPLQRTITDEEGNVKTFITDGLPPLSEDGPERILEVQENNLGETYHTRYFWDPLDNLVKIIDAQDNVKTMFFDGLSRKTSMNDPDKGHMEYVYDDSGNLIQTTDNKDQIIDYSYDGAGRLTSEDYLDAAGISPDVSYIYDSVSQSYPAAKNLKGKLASVSDLSGGQFFSYDPRGNISWTIKRVGWAPPTFIDFRTEKTYDAMDRVISTTFPDGDTVSYTYNNRNLLETIPGFVTATSYHASGQINTISHANDIFTDYTYDPRQRLYQLETVNTSLGGDPLQSLEYTFDGVSNITDITDLRPQVLATSPQNGSQSFQYDDLYRLTHAEGTGYGAIDFQYDRIGNMIFKESPAGGQRIDDTLINLGIMEYGGSATGSSNRDASLPGYTLPGPHAVTGTASGLLYDYDDNGNMISHATGDVYDWDFKDRLTHIQKGTTNTLYVYDYQGQRVSKIVDDGSTEKTTHYVSKEFEFREGEAIKYIWAGSRRVAQVKGRLNSEETGQTQTLNLNSGWNFFSLAVEPVDTAVATVLQDLGTNFLELWTFDAVSQTYQGYVPSEGISDIADIHGLTGYLIRLANPATLSVSGTKLTGPVSLQEYWNLVPSPSNSFLDISEVQTAVTGNFDSLWGFEGADESWKSYLENLPSYLNNLEMTEPGMAYWLYKDGAVAGDQLDFVEKPAEIKFYHPDHLGSSNLVTDATGAVVEETQFYPFGRPRHEERNGFESAYKYTGKELDKESGLMYYEARYYDPVVGRFASVDPLYVNKINVNTNEHINTYGYVGNNPLVFVDPTGRYKIDKKGVITITKNGESLSQIAKNITGNFEDSKSLKRVSGWIKNKAFDPNKIIPGEQFKFTDEFMKEKGAEVVAIPLVNNKEWYKIVIKDKEPSLIEKAIFMDSYAEIYSAIGFFSNYHRYDTPDDSGKISSGFGPGTSVIDSMAKRDLARFDKYRNDPYFIRATRMDLDSKIDKATGLDDHWKSSGSSQK